MMLSSEWMRGPLSPIAVMEVLSCIYDHITNDLPKNSNAHICVKFGRARIRK